MLRATVYSNPTIDYVYIEDKINVRAGGPGYYYALYSKLLDSKVQIIGQASARDYYYLKKAHDNLGAELNVKISDCTQKFLLLYSSELSQKRIAYPLTRCSLIYRQLNNSDVHIWSPTILASKNDVLVLSYLVRQRIPLGIDFQGLARSPEYLHIYLNVVKHRVVEYAHMDMEEYHRICSIIGETNHEKCLKNLKIREAIVSNGSEPGFSYCDEKIYQAHPPFKVHNEESTGAGDVLLFSFIINRLKGKSCVDSLKSSLEVATIHVHLLNIFTMNELIDKIRKSISIKALLD